MSHDPEKPSVSSVEALSEQQAQPGALALAPGSALYRITAEIVAADRDAALSILVKLVNDGYASLRERGDLPIAWSQGDVSGNGEFRAGLYSESVTELDRQLAQAREYMADCAKLERKVDILARHAREAFFRAEARRKAAQPLPNNRDVPTRTGSENKS